MKRGTRQPLIDLNDIYLSNQNVGARAVRECIFTVLPTEFVDAAQDLCRATLEHGEGKPLTERVADMVKAFDGIGVKVAQLEAKLERKRGQWTAGDVASMGIAFKSIQSGDTTRDDEFPPVVVTAAEIEGKAP